MEPYLQQIPPLRKPIPRGMHLYTIYARFKSEGFSSIEELDVVAASERAARQFAKEVLKRDYEPGGRIVKTIQRLPGEIFF